MKKGIMTVGIMVGMVFMLTSAFVSRAAEKATANGLASTAPEPAAATLYYVSSDGNCGGRTPCYSKIQDAIDAAPDGTDILVRQGTYQESISLTSAKRVVVKGGYDASYSQQTPNSTFHPGIWSDHHSSAKRFPEI